MRAACTIATIALLALAACSTQPDVAETIQERYALPNAPYILHLASFGTDQDVEPPSWFQRWIIGERVKAKRATIARPWGIGTAPGKVFINDGRGSSGYWVLDLAQGTLRLVRHPSLEGGTGLAVDERGYKYFAVPKLLESKARGEMGSKDETGLIVVFDAQDRFVSQQSFPGRPVGIATWKDRLYVTDVLNQRVAVLDRGSLEVQFAFGEAGGGDRQFRFPKAIAVDDQGQVYVGDTFNGRVKVFDGTGELVSQYGHRARLLGAFMNLSGLAVDDARRVYAVDAGARLKILNEEVQVLDATRFYAAGEPVASLDAKPSERKDAVFGYFQKPNALGPFAQPGVAATSLYHPLDIAIDYQNTGYFASLLPPDSAVRIEYLLWMTSEGAFNGRNVSVFAFTSEP